MNNKYLFRLYHIDKQGNIFSPFLSGHTSGFDNTEVASGTRDDVGNDFGNLWHKGKLYKKNSKHFGFSAFGKVDPRYSIFSSSDLTSDELVDAVQNEISKYVPEHARNTNLLKEYYRDNETNDYDFLTSHKYAPNKRTGYISKFNGDNGSADLFTISPELFDFDSDSVWDDFVYDIDMYDTFNLLHVNDTSNGDRVVLVTTPEDKIISVDELVNNGYTQQRDFPSELVTSEVIPLREFSEYPTAIKNYEKLRNKGASGTEAFGESFKIEPKDIVSDEQLKGIYKDMCFFVDNNKKKHKNILSAIRELGQ